MALLQRVLKSMERIAPQSLAEHAWDNVGLLVGKTHSIGKKFAPHEPSEKQKTEHTFCPHNHRGSLPQNQSRVRNSSARVSDN